MRSSVRPVVIALASLVMAVAVSGAVAQQPVVVSVQELIQRDHRIDVPAGTEVVWGDPRFERVWLAPRAGAPAVEIRRRDSVPCSRSPVPTGAPSRSWADIEAMTFTR